MDAWQVPMSLMGWDTVVVASVTNIGCVQHIDESAVLLLHHRQTHVLRQQPAHQPNMGDQTILLIGSQDQADHAYAGHTS